VSRVGDALCCVHLDKFADVILPRTGKMLTDHSSLRGWKTRGRGKVWELATRESALQEH
jgi:hypothetical protein